MIFNDSLGMMLFYLGFQILMSLVVPVPLLVGAILSKRISHSWAPIVLIVGAVIWLIGGLAQIGSIYLIRYGSTAIAGYASMGIGVVKTAAGIIFAVGFIKLVSEKKA
ncbi:MAG: hypothetical protein JXX29_06380 [Deltaproteobacteria bacterium]|nr:hypothetical protein [Deltaproteobacteria bacterium]MBN2671278.1 hypothetical protein [Deltaproteobacteria bacterium]